MTLFYTTPAVQSLWGPESSAEPLVATHADAWPNQSMNTSQTLFESIDGLELGEVQAHQTGLYEKRALAQESLAVIEKALASDAVARRILAKGLSLQVGQLIGVRVNINVIKSTGVAVHTIHKGTSVNGHRSGRGFFRGEVLTYVPVVRLRDAYFNVDQKAREGIATGVASKSPMASIDGAFAEFNGEPIFDGIEVSFQPKRVHLFVDADNHGIQYAEDVTIMGHRAYLRGRVRYYTQSAAPAKVGIAKSDVRFKPVDASVKVTGWDCELSDNYSK